MAQPFEITDADIWVGDVAPSAAASNDFWFDTSAVPFLGLNIIGRIPSGPPTDDGTNHGDAWIAEDTGNLWVWDGTTWVDLGPFVGPQGPAGPQGSVLLSPEGGLNELEDGSIAVIPTPGGGIIVDTDGVRQDPEWVPPWAENNAVIHEETHVVDENEETFIIEHNFGNRWVTVQIFHVESGQSMGLMVTCKDENTVEIDFSGAPMGAEFVIVVSGRRGPMGR